MAHTQYALTLLMPIEEKDNMKNFSVLVPNLGSSQLSFFVITQINKMFEEKTDKDAIVFYENMSSSCMPVNFAVMDISECWSHAGPVIATSFSTAEKLRCFPSERKLFYVWDLEWIRNATIKQYDRYKNAILDSSIELVARSKFHKAAIENCFNREVSNVIEDFDINKIINILE